MLETTIAGSLPKPSWLAESEKLWPAWKLEGSALAAGKIDATILAVKLQEDAGIDIVSDGEQARIHFVHGFLANLDGIDFNRRQTIGIRADRYKAEVPTVTGPIRRKGSVHRAEASAARAHTRRKLKFTLPGPMTIVDTIADEHYRDRADARPRLRRSAERGGARARGARRRRGAIRRAGLQRLHARRPGLGRRRPRTRRRGARLHHRRPHLLRLRHQGQYRLESDPRRALAPIRGDLSRAGQEPHRPGLARMPQFARAHRADRAA